MRVIKDLDVQPVGESGLFDVVGKLLNKGGFSAGAVGLKAGEANHQRWRTRRGALARNGPLLAVQPPLSHVFDQEPETFFKNRSHCLPYKSESQRKYLHAKKPSVAAKYDKHGGKGKALPAKVAKPIKRGRSK